MKTRINLTVDANLWELAKKKYPNEISSKFNEFIRMLLTVDTQNDLKSNALHKLELAKQEYEQIVQKQEVTQMEKIHNELLTKEQQEYDEKYERNYAYFREAELSTTDPIALKYYAQKAGLTTEEDYLRTKYRNLVQSGEWVLQ